jgi:hypothetical protein
MSDVLTLSQIKMPGTARSSRSPPTYGVRQVGGRR